MAPPRLVAASVLTLALLVSLPAPAAAQVCVGVVSLCATAAGSSAARPGERSASMITEISSSPFMCRARSLPLGAMTFP